MGASDFPLLAALLAPVAAQDFLQRHWPDKPLEVHGPPDRLPPVLRDPAFASAAELARRYSGRLRFTNGGSDQMVEVGDGSTAALLDMALTVHFVDLDSCVANARGFCRQLESELGLHEGSISLSAFAAARDNGLPRHYDAAELVSIQLVGGKRFHYAPVSQIEWPCGNQYAPNAAPFDELYPQAGGGFPDPGDATFMTAEMRPGSVLFVPRGFWHYTSASENSLSVSIAISAPPALRSLLDQLRCLLLQDPRWRRPLYQGAGREDALRRATELIASLPAITARVTANDLLDAPARVDWRLAHIEASTRLQRTPHGGIEIGAPGPGGKLPLRFVAGHRPSLAREFAGIEITPATVPLLRWIEARTHGPFAVAELAAAHPQVPQAALKDLLRLCVQAQFLRVLWYPALDAMH